MIDSPLAFHALEWPAPGARVRGPVVWLRGWIVAKPGFAFVDVRVRSTVGLARGVLGLPRVDLARHFGSPRPWLPAGFVVGVPSADGSAELQFEAQDPHGVWVTLQTIALTVASDGAEPGCSEGEVRGIDTHRVPHLPFHGHLDEPDAEPAVTDGTVPLFGWLLHENASIQRVTATFDGLVFWPLHHGLTDESLAAKVAHPAARHARLRGRVPAPPTLATPACLRVYAELADGSAHLCFAQRVAPRAAPATTAPARAATPLAAAELPPLPSGRPRRALLVVRTLRPDDATLRALDVAAHLRASGRWVARVIATEDGALRDAFEAALCPAQLIDVSRYVDATGAPADAELAALDRQVWWRHLDAVALFDPISEWAGRVAHRHGLTVFRDPVDSLHWFSPTSGAWRHDPAAAAVAPLRGLDQHGAHLFVTALAGRAEAPAVRLTDVRDHADESLLRAALAPVPQLSCGAAPDAMSALFAPVFREMPLHRVLTAAAAGIPVVTTPHPVLADTFSSGELVFVPPGNPLALAHAVLDLAANPTAAARRAEAAQRVVHARHHPADQLARWLRALEAAVAAR